MGTNLRFLQEDLNTTQGEIDDGGLENEIQALAGNETFSVNQREFKNLIPNG